MKRIITPTFIMLIVLAGFFVPHTYAVIAWTLAAVAAAVWIASEVIRWQRR